MKRLQAVLFLIAALFAAVPASAQSVPNPILRLTGTEAYSAGGKNWVRYKFEVHNRAQYPAEMFAPAPGLPPCGTNTNSSRSWVDFFAQDGKRLYGFCALGTPQDLDKIWFAVEEGQVPPSWIYIEIMDRQTGKKYRSNLAETAL